MALRATLDGLAGHLRAQLSALQGSSADVGLSPGPGLRLHIAEGVLHHRRRS